MNVRAQAARVLERVIAQGQSLSEALPATRDKVKPRDRALLAELCYGTLRQHWRLQALTEQLLDKPLKARDRIVGLLIEIGLYQLEYMRIPAHAAVTETVAATKPLDRAWARGLTNALLRNFQRRRDALLQTLEQQPAAAAGYPQWLYDLLAQHWPDELDNILTASNAQAPMSLRVNLQRVQRDRYLEQLAEAGLEAVAFAGNEAGVVLKSPADTRELPGFDQGLCSVQDISGQLVAPLLQPQSGQRILDACAAPGSKTGHLLELCPDAQVTAVDISESRLTRVADNLGRLGLRAELKCGDAGDPPSWWDGQPFQAILLDAPCSATGVIRRHPDIRIHRRSSDIATLAETQAKMLETLWPLLDSGGMLLYSTCSILPAENANQSGRFLASHEDAKQQTIQLPVGRACEQGWQILPGEQDLDGFYFAALGKTQ